MQFSAHTLLPYASGALGAWDSPEGICLRRLTPQQLQQFDADPHRAIRTRCNAGIVLEMDTDAAALEMDYRLQKDAPRPYGYVEVFVDGAPFAAEGSDTQMALEGSLRLALPSGAKRLQIVLPALHEMAISRLALQGETRVAPVAHRFRYLAFGDSISQGYDAIFSSQAYPTRIARAIDALLVNQAIGGDVFRANYPQALPASRRTSSRSPMAPTTGVPARAKTSRRPWRAFSKTCTARIPARQCSPSRPYGARMAKNCPGSGRLARWAKPSAANARNTAIL